MKIVIDKKECEAQYGEYLIDVARRNGISIPTLCHSEALPGLAACRLCLVEVVENGRQKFVTSCVYPVTGEIEVTTGSEEIRKIRRTLLLLLSARVSDNGLLKQLKEEYEVPDPQRFSSDGNEKCILCGLCVKACEAVGPCAISTVNRGITKKVSTPYDEPSSACIGCGSCAQICPTGAIVKTEQGGRRNIWGRSFDLIECRTD